MPTQKKRSDADFERIVQRKNQVIVDKSLDFVLTEFSRMDRSPVAVAPGPRGATNAALVAAFGWPVVSGKFGGLWTFAPKRPFDVRVFCVYMLAKGSEIAASREPVQRWNLNNLDFSVGLEKFKKWLGSRLR